MEDISREMEREITSSKPKPIKLVRKKRVIIVDDFGVMKSGDYLKILVTILSIISMVCFIAAALFYYLYTGLSKAVKPAETRLVLAEKKVYDLTREKEILMARLVIEGKEPGIEGESIESSPEMESSNEIMPPRVIKKNIDIEKFSVTKDKTTGDLLVRFDIRNISTEQVHVSGRIFTILKPGNNNEDQWLVVPASSLKNGIPSEYKKGQYFLITNFKPVKFIIKNHADPDFFKQASIFIFNEQADLIFEKRIDITEAK